MFKLSTDKQWRTHRQVMTRCLPRRRNRHSHHPDILTSCHSQPALRACLALPAIRNLGKLQFYIHDCTYDYIPGLVSFVNRTMEVDEKLNKLIREPRTYADFEYLTYWQIVVNNASAVMVFLAWIKVHAHFLLLVHLFISVCIQIIYVRITHDRLE